MKNNYSLIRKIAQKLLSGTLLDYFVQVRTVLFCFWNRPNVFLIECAPNKWPTDEIMDNNPDKLLKKAIRERQKRIKPKECPKYIRVVIDSNILSATYGQEFIAGLNGAAGEMKYDVRNLTIKDSVIWERNTGQLALNEINTLSGVWQTECQVVKIVTHTDLLQLIKSNTLHAIADDFDKNYGSMQHIVLYIRNNGKPNASISSALIELQIMHQLKILQVEPSVKELINQIKCLTKTISEIPYKKQKFEILDSFKKFLANDKKKCVRVEGMNGFGQLWQQHLNRLPLVTLEVAETIINKYSCPKKLLEDLKSNAAAVKDISELRIKRSGPIVLQTDRRIGNVLSQKLYTIYSSKDPMTLI